MNSTLFKRERYAIYDETMQSRSWLEGKTTISKQILKSTIFKHQTNANKNIAFFVLSKFTRFWQMIKNNIPE